MYTYKKEKVRLFHFTEERSARMTKYRHWSHRLLKIDHEDQQLRTEAENKRSHEIPDGSKRFEMGRVYVKWITCLNRTC